MSKLLAFALLAASVTSSWQIARPGYHFEFPRDYFDHPDYQTEWWYYTGNLESADGRHFGFELTFFRSALKDQLAGTPVWRPNQIYLAHLALSDLNGHVFYHEERMNRAGPGLAGVSLAQRRYWNGNWSVQWADSDVQNLQAVTDNLGLLLQLKPLKPVIINGQNGIDVKGPLPGEASHYLSFTRLSAEGALDWNNKRFHVHGQAWMDHEFFTEPSDPELLGWDWFAIQLDNGDDLMLYRLRRKTTGAQAYSTGTYVDRQGHAEFLAPGQFSLQPGLVWNSSSGAHYPVEWKISVPQLQLQLTEKTTLPNQELYTPGAQTPTYWEGAVTYSGSMHSQPVHGVGYLEMTGYGQTVWLGAK